MKSVLTFFLGILLSVGGTVVYAQYVKSDDMYISSSETKADLKYATTTFDSYDAMVQTKENYLMHSESLKYLISIDEKLGNIQNILWAKK